MNIGHVEKDMEFIENGIKMNNQVKKSTFEYNNMPKSNKK
jgi:hypothetical protein